jgi:hypothetical protein
MNEQSKSSEKAPLLDPCGNIIDEAPAIASDPEFELLIEEEEAREKVAKFRSDLAAMVVTNQQKDQHILTSGGRVVPTHVVRGFSKPKAEFVPVCEDYVKGFYPTLELTNGTEVQVGTFCHTLEESEGVITVILEEVRRKAANY